MVNVKKVIGYCPEINDNKTINVEYRKIEQYSDKTIAGRFECDKASYGNCKYYNENKKCPIYNTVR